MQYTEGQKDNNDPIMWNRLRVWRKVYDRFFFLQIVKMDVALNALEKRNSLEIIVVQKTLIALGKDRVIFKEPVR